MNCGFLRESRVLRFVRFRVTAASVFALVLASAVVIMPAGASAADEDAPMITNFSHRGVLNPTCLPMRADSKWCYSLTELLLNSIEYSPHPAVRLRASWLCLLLLGYGDVSVEFRGTLFHPRIHGSIGVVGAGGYAANFDDAGVVEGWVGVRPAFTVSGKRWDLTNGVVLVRSESSKMRLVAYSTARFAKTDHVMFLSEALIEGEEGEGALAYLAPAVRLQYKRFFVDLAIAPYSHLEISNDRLHGDLHAPLPYLSLSYLF